MTDSAEEQIVATDNADEQMVDALSEEQIASEAPVEDQAVPDQVVDETSIEDLHVEDRNAMVEASLEHQNGEDHNTVVETSLEDHHIEDDNTVLKTPLDHHHIEDENTVIETRVEHHHGEDHNAMVETQLENQNSEDYNTVVETSLENQNGEDHHTVVENQNSEDHNTVVETLLENQNGEDHNTLVETSLENQNGEDHHTVVETPLEDYHIEDHNAMVETSVHHHVEDHSTVVETSIEHHQVEDQNLPEDHSTMVEYPGEEHHQMIAGEPDHHTAINHHVEDNHMASDLIDHHNLHISTDPEEDHMVADLTDHHVDANDHHMITITHGDEHESAEAHLGGDQMDSIDIIRNDEIESFPGQEYEEESQAHMMVTIDDVTIMSIPENNHHNHHDYDQNGQHEISLYDEQQEKLLITPYEGETEPSKRRKRKSMVWDYFTIEPAGEGCRRACCKQCKQTFAYSTGTKVAGTSHLKRHIAKGTCQERTGLPTGSAGPRKRYKTSSSPAAAMTHFDPDRCRNEVARMIIMHDYPLHLVEHPGFLAFIRNLQPQFQMVSFDAVQGDCVATYLMEKQSMKKVVDSIPGRVCLSLDMWTSRQSVGYVFVAAHFIDSEWKLQRRLLNVVMEPYPDSEAALSHAVAVCLHDWSLVNRLFSVTLAHRQSEAALETLRPQLTVKNPLVLGGQLVLSGCLARTFCSAAMDVLDEGKDSVRRVRESVKHVKTSDSQDEKFSELREQLRGVIPSERSLCVDDQTRWDTTYNMLAAAFELKEVFSLLDASDPDFKTVAAPSDDDWRRVETLCYNLKLLHDSAAILSSATATSPTPIAFFHEVWKILTELSRLAAAASDDEEFSASVALRAKEKVEQYWKENSLALAAAVVMDPRFKMKLVEFSFNKLYGDDAPAFVKVVDDGIHELFNEYAALPLPLTPTYDENGSDRSATEGGPAGLMSSESNGLEGFDVFIMETTSQQMKPEIDQYLEEALLARVHDFDVLNWWRLNKPKYPTLSKMAMDILSMTVSAAPPESVFKTRPNEMDAYRSLLRPETLEAIICAKDWMIPSDPASALLKMEY